jgi:hypothetical protein
LEVIFMSEQHLHYAPSLSVRNDQPLIGVILEEQGHEVVHYFTEDAVMDEPAADPSIQAALSLAGAWRDLDWDETAWSGSNWGY